MYEQKAVVLKFFEFWHQFCIDFQKFYHFWDEVVFPCDLSQIYRIGTSINDCQSCSKQGIRKYLRLSALQQ